MKSPILGSAYTAISVNAADNRMVNLYPEMVPEGGKEPAFLMKREGLTFRAFADGSAAVANSPIRGMIATYDLSTTGTPPVLYVVCGSNVYSATDYSTWTNLGAITGTDSVSIASSGTELFIATSAGDGYIVNIAANTLTQITDLDFPGARQVTYLNGRFVFCNCEDQKVWCTDLLAGGSIDALNFASAEASPDPVIGVFAVNGELWVFGTQTTEVWQDVGGTGFPYAPIQSVNINVGCISGFTVTKLDNSLFWLGQDSNGRGIVYRSNGYSAQRISTHAIEWQIQQYDIKGPPFYAASTEFEPWGLGYQLNGHLFYVLTIPAGGTWVYDVVTQAWHKRTDQNGSVYRARGQALFVLLNEQHVLVGDYAKNIIYRLGGNVDSDPDDPGNANVPIEWLRSWRALPTGANNLKRTVQHSLQLDCETGTTNDADPQVSLRFSDDGGHTWSSSRSVSMGASGNYKKRVIWRRLGATMKLRDRVYEVSGTADAKIAIMGAELILSPTDA